ncbi:MAG: hypothetical protein ACFFBD_12775, partial [Candidatus Hodarchaeota archaeon]
YDSLYSRCRTQIQNTIDDWFCDKESVNSITLKSLNKLKMRLADAIFLEQKRVESSEISVSLRSLLGMNLDFLNTIGRSMDRLLRIGVFGSTKDEHILLQNAVNNIFPLLQGMDTSTDGKFTIYRFSNLYIERGSLEIDELIDFKKITTLTNISSWKNVPKDFDGILLTISIPGITEVITKNIQVILRKTPTGCPIALFIRYSSDFSGEISDTPIPKAIAEAGGRTISLVEARDDKNSIQTALIDFVAKIVYALQS